MARIAKRIKKVREGIDPAKLYPLDEAVKMLKERATAKFDETVEVAMNLGVDPRHADQMVRGVVSLPNGTGRSARVAVFARGDKAEEAKAAGADVVGAEDLVTAVQGGTIDFDRCIATPDMMPLVGRLGKVLGPRGLMPNPKVGTVTNDVTAAVKDAKGGAVEFRVEKAGIIHAGIGKASFDDDGAGRQHPGIRRCRAEGAAGRCQGHVRSARRDLVDHGARPQDRPGDAVRRRSGGVVSYELPAGGDPGRRNGRRTRPPPDPVRDCRRRAAGLIRLACNRREGTGFPVRTSWPMRRPRRVPAWGTGCERLRPLFGRQANATGGPPIAAA